MRDAERRPLLRRALGEQAERGLIQSDENHEEDPFWAIRGAGAGNFGVVTSLVFRTVPAPDVTNFHLAWPFSRRAG